MLSIGNNQLKEKVKDQILASILMKKSMVESCVSDIEAAAEIMINSIRNGGKIRIIPKCIDMSTTQILKKIN